MRACVPKRLRQAPTSASVSGSPATNSQRSAGSVVPLRAPCSQACSTVGVVWTTLIAARASQPVGSSRSRSCGMHKVAPLASGRKMSRSSGSNDRPISCDTRSSEFTPNSLRCQSMNWLRPAWRPSTALGVPVLPEVKKMYAGSSGKTATGVNAGVPASWAGPINRSSRSGCSTSVVRVPALA